MYCEVFFFNDTATTEIYTLSLHDALPISGAPVGLEPPPGPRRAPVGVSGSVERDVLRVLARHLPPSAPQRAAAAPRQGRSEEHTSELQSRQYLVCRLLLEKKKK